jgi:MFS family permease
MTIGQGSFDALNATLLGAAAVGGGVFVLVQARAAAPLVPLAVFRHRGLGAGLATAALVMTVMMATLVVGPFYLSGALGLDTALVGLVMSAGPLVAALTAVPAGRLVDRFGAERVTIGGLIALAAGSFILAVLPLRFGIAGYVAPVVVVTAGYALFQTANNAAVMRDLAQDRRGVVSGMLSLARNFGLITGASAMGAVFALASGGADVSAERPQAIANGMGITFAVGTILIAGALVIATGSRAFAARPAPVG